jgi:hypothetical protein
MSGEHAIESPDELRIGRRECRDVRVLHCTVAVYRISLEQLCVSRKGIVAHMEETPGAIYL